MKVGARLPAGRVRIRTGEGLARGLLAALCAIPGAPAGGSAFLPVQGDTNLTYMARSSGYWRGHRYPFHDGTLSSAGWGTYLTGGGISSNAQALTMAGLVRNTGAVANAGLMVTSSFGGSFPCLRFGQEFGGDSSFGVTHRSGNGSYLTVSNAGDNALKARFAVARIRADDRLDLWIDGAYIGSTTHSRGGFNTFYNAGVVLTAYYSLYASLSIGYAWDRFLSDAEVIALSEDPFRLIDTGEPQASLSLDGAILTNPQFARPIADLVNYGWIRS